MLCVLCLCEEIVGVAESSLEAVPALNVVCFLPLCSEGLTGDLGDNDLSEGLWESTRACAQRREA